MGTDCIAALEALERRSRVRVRPCGIEDRGVMPDVRPGPCILPRGHAGLHSDEAGRSWRRHGGTQ